MPHTPSAKKRLKTSEKRRVKNRAVRSSVKTQVKKVRAATAAGDVATGETELRLAMKKLDQAAAKGVIHKNAAARTKSRLSAQLKHAKGK